MPTKAAAAAGLGVLLLGLPLAMLSSASKAGYIEAKHEKNKTEQNSKSPLN